jgi:hypothetical protein
MSAAANAAGYLYAHGQLLVSDLDAQLDAESSHPTAQSRSSRPLEPKTVPWQGQSQPVKQVPTPRIEYRKRRFYPMPSAVVGVPEEFTPLKSTLPLS